MCNIFRKKRESLLCMYNQSVVTTPVLEPNGNTHKQSTGRNIMVFTTSQSSVQFPHHLPVHHPHRSVSSSASLSSEPFPARDPWKFTHPFLSPHKSGEMKHDSPKDYRRENSPGISQLLWQGHWQHTLNCSVFHTVFLHCLQETCPLAWPPTMEWKEKPRQRIFFVCECILHIALFTKLKGKLGSFASKLFWQNKCHFQFFNFSCFCVQP